MRHLNADRWTEICGIRTLRDVLLAVTPADANAVDNVSLLSFVPQPAGLVWAGWARGPMDNV